MPEMLNPDDRPMMLTAKAAARMIGGSMTTEWLTNCIKRNQFPGYYGVGRSGELAWFVRRDAVETFVGAVEASRAAG